MPVPILKQGAILIASVQAALTDSDAERLRHDLMERVSRYRAHGTTSDQPDTWTVLEFEADEAAAGEYAIAVPLDVAAGSYFSQDGVGRVFDGRELVGSSAWTGLPAA